MKLWRTKPTDPGRRQKNFVEFFFAKEFPQAGKGKEGVARREKQASKSHSLTTASCKLQAKLPTRGPPPSRTFPFSQARTPLFGQFESAVRIATNAWIENWTLRGNKNSPSQSIFRHYRQTRLLLLLCRFYKCRLSDRCPLHPMV